MIHLLLLALLLLFFVGAARLIFWLMRFVISVVVIGWAIALAGGWVEGAIELYPGEIVA
jgi:hypothetical protein